MPRPFSVHVVIVGAGLGGLVAAIGVSRAGHQVTIVERAAQLGEIGAGIQLPPNATRILDRWGILSKLRLNSMQPDNIIIRSYRDDSILSLLNLTPLINKTYHSPYLHVHRATFHKTLCDEAARLGVVFRLGSTVTGIDFQRPAVQVQDKEDITADLILGADGLKSACREALLGHSDPLHTTGDMAYRIAIATDAMKEYQELIDLAMKPNFNYWAGPGGHAVSYLVKNGTLFNMVLTAVDELPHGVYQAEGDVHEMQERFKNWSGSFKQLLQLAKETTVWKLLNSVELEAWRHPNGNFALLGDACHATLPYLAQGAAQAVEDGAVLGALFNRAETKSEIYDVLEIYEKIRKSRTTQIVHGSTEFGAIMHMYDGEAQRERDLNMTQCNPFEGFPNKWADPVFQKYLFGYDVDTEVAKAWSLYKARKMTQI